MRANLTKLRPAIATLVLLTAAVMALGPSANALPLWVPEAAYAGNTDCAYEGNQRCEPVCGDSGVVCIGPSISLHMSLRVDDHFSPNVSALICQDLNGNLECEGGAAGDYSDKLCGTEKTLTEASGWQPGFPTFLFMGGSVSADILCPGEATLATVGIVSVSP